MKKRNKGNHGIYELTCISDKCSRRFKVLYDTQEVKQTIGGTSLHALRIVSTRLTYPFNGCPFCGAWWPTGPLDASAYPPNMTNVRLTKGQVQQMTKTLRSIWDGTAGSDSAEGWR